MSNENCSNITWTVKDSKHEIILTGTVPKSKYGKGPHSSHAFNHEIDITKVSVQGEYIFSTEKGDKITLSIKEKPYAFIPSEILRYLRVQRSGSINCLDRNVSHMGDSSCAIMKKTSEDNESWILDKQASKVNMLGGWYDAGDYIKFTLTTAYTTHQLLHAYTINPSLFQSQKYSTSNYNDLLDEAKWGLDYLCKVMPNEQTFIIQVGGAEDHKQGNRLADQDALDGKRNAYNALSSTQMGYTIAALALGAQVFDSITYPGLHKRYKEEAIKIYNVALKQSTSPAWVKEGWESFYGDEKGADNMQLAATELFKLTGNKDYLEKGKLYCNQAQAAYWYSWADANMLAHNRIYPFYNASESYIQEDLNHFRNYSLKPENIWRLPHEYTWASLYSLLGVANNALLFDLNKQQTNYSTLAYDVLDYTLGKNNWGLAMIASPNIPHSVKNIYAQTYVLQPEKLPIGAVAEGPGDRTTHEDLKQYFNIPPNNSFELFNTDHVVFYDLNTDFQTMETTIVGLSDALLFFTLMSKE